MDPRTEKPTGTFDDHHGSFTEAQATSSGLIKLELYANGAPIGSMGMNSSGWAIASPTPVVLETYVYKDGKTYYKLQSTEKYLSVSRNAYVGFYAWSGATGWRKEGNAFISEYNNQKLSIYQSDKEYLYAWNKYAVLDVKFVQL